MELEQVDIFFSVLRRLQVGGQGAGVPSKFLTFTLCNGFYLID